MLDKNFDQITPEDVTNLCRDGVYENQLLELSGIFLLSETGLIPG
jgi:hypothetical protein